MTGIIIEFSRQIEQFAPKISIGIFVLVIFWIIGIITEKVTVLFCRRIHLQRDLILLFGRVARLLFIIMGIICGLGTMGVNISALVAGLGLTGFALGFALRDALSNVLSGALILIYHPFKCGDKIIVMGYEGIVVKIDLRYTTLKDRDRKIMIPNSKLFSNPFVIPNL